MTIQIEYEAEREWEIDYRPIIEEIVVAQIWSLSAKGLVPSFECS